MRNRTFPRDAVEATNARIKYGLDGATYARLAAQLYAWHLGSATFHSDGDIRQLIRASACSKPPVRLRPTA
jgi:hypothetical protein